MISVVVSALGERFGPIPHEGMVTTTRSPSRKMGIASNVVLFPLRLT
jgi:hypothetical protein